MASTDMAGVDLAGVDLATPPPMCALYGQTCSSTVGCCNNNGTCLTPYLAGEPDHRDQVLEENGRQRYVLICCSRAKTPVLVLDL